MQDIKIDYIRILGFDNKGIKHLNNIKKDKEHNVYFRPHNDSLGNEWKFGNKYNKKTSPLNLRCFQ